MLAVARLKNGTAQGFRLANSARIFFYLSWYDYNTYFRLVTNNDTVVNVGNKLRCF